MTQLPAGHQRARPAEAVQSRLARVAPGQSPGRARPARGKRIARIMGAVRGRSHTNTTRPDQWWVADLAALRASGPTASRSANVPLLGTANTTGRQEGSPTLVTP